MRFLMDKAAKEGRGVGLACQEVSTVSVDAKGGSADD